MSTTVSEFRAELRAWLAENLTDELRAAADVRSATDDRNFELRQAWERRLVSGGWLGTNWPREFGGRGLDDEFHAAFVAEHVAAGAPLWATVTGRDLLAPTLLRHGSDELKHRFLPPILAGDELWGQGYSEPDAGSDLAGLRTIARRDGDEWVISGQKIWMSYGARADWLFVLCRTSPEAKPHRALSLLLVPAHQAGVEIRPIRHMAGGADFCEVFFTDARTEASLVVGDVDGGWPVVMGSLDDERFLTMLPYQAQFRPQFDELVRLLRERGALTDPVVRDRVVRQWTGLRIIELANAQMLADVMSKRDLGAASSLAKMRWGHWHRGFANEMVSLLGPSALAGDLTALAPEIFLNSRAETIYGGAHEIQKNIVAERLLGLPREPRV